MARIRNVVTLLACLGVCAAETSEGNDLGMAAGGYAVQAGTLRHAAQEERARAVTLGCKVAVRPGARGNWAPPGLIPQQAVQALDIQGQTHQIPLALHGAQAAHTAWAKAQNTLNPTDGCFYQPLALGVGFMPLGGVQFALYAPGGRSPGTLPEAVCPSRPSAT